MSDTDKTKQPMDASIRENVTGTAASNTPRACYAVKTLIKEVTDLFPETTHTVGNYNGRNVGLSVAFDLSDLDADTDRADLTALLQLLGDPAHNEDQRVAGVVVDFATNTVVVSMKPSARTQDSRESFGVEDAWSVLTDGESPEVFGGTEFNFGPEATDMDMFGDTRATRGGLLNYFGGSS